MAPSLEGVASPHNQVGSSPEGNGTLPFTHAGGNPYRPRQDSNMRPCIGGDALTKGWVVINAEVIKERLVRHCWVEHDRKLWKGMVLGDGDVKNFLVFTEKVMQGLVYVYIKITRKSSKTGKHGHGERKSTKEAKDAKPKLGKVNLQSTLGQPQSKH
ncbi:hypothetical protein Tco_0371052 [Tanacetum coccineum]